MAIIEFVEGEAVEKNKDKIKTEDIAK